MGFKSVMISLALVLCLVTVAFGQGPKNQIVEPSFPEETMSAARFTMKLALGSIQALVTLSSPFETRACL